MSCISSGQGLHGMEIENTFNGELPYILESNPHPVFGDFLNEKS
jgi:hypothetical protein